MHRHLRPLLWRISWSRASTPQFVETNLVCLRSVDPGQTYLCLRYLDSVAVDDAGKSLELLFTRGTIRRPNTNRQRHEKTSEKQRQDNRKDITPSKLSCAHLRIAPSAALVGKGVLPIGRPQARSHEHPLAAPPGSLHAGPGHGFVVAAPVINGSILEVTGHPFKIAGGTSFPAVPIELAGRHNDGRLTSSKKEL